MHVVFMPKLRMGVFKLEMSPNKDDKKALSHETSLGLQTSAGAFQCAWKGSLQLLDPLQMKGHRQAMPYILDDSEWRRSPNFNLQ